MKKIIIRYSEIALKKGNRKRFENKLSENIKWTLNGYAFKLSRTWGRFFITDFDDSLATEEIFIEKLKKVPGISNFSVSYILNNRDLNEIGAKAVELLSKDYDNTSKGFFKVETKRLDKRYPKNSAEISRELADVILPNFSGFVVNLSKPDVIVGVELYEKDTLIFINRYRGVDGLPVGSSGKMTLLLSGGIDSPVAGYKIISRGVKLNAVYYHSIPYTSEGAKIKVVDLATILSKFQNNYFDLFVVHFTEIQRAVRKDCKDSYGTVLDRRYMVKIADLIAEKTQHKALITGESIGQVASQTIENITSVDIISKLPILRPLIGDNKLEITRIAQKINTYETSIRPFDDCCVLFAPKSPTTKVSIKYLDIEEAHLNEDELITEALSKTKVIKIRRDEIEEVSWDDYLLTLR
jgi:thiamine biosynthesis protein ThiI